MELSDREALKDILAKGTIVIDEGVLECESLKDELVYLLNKIEEFLMVEIEKIPTIESRPRGEWKQRTDFDEDNNAIFECSNCLHGDTQAKGSEVPFCWYCGADMRKKV